MVINSETPQRTQPDAKKRRKRLTARQVAIALSQPWTGSEFQRRAYWQKKQAERVARVEHLEHLKSQRVERNSANLRAELQRQEQQRLSRESRERAERAASLALGRASIPEG